MRRKVKNIICKPGVHEDFLKFHRELKDKNIDARNITQSETVRFLLSCWQELNEYLPGNQRMELF